MLSENLKAKIQLLSADNPEISHIFSELDKEYTTFISSTSHELRNTITLMNSSLQFIESRHPEVKSFQFWNEVQNDLTHIRDTIAVMSDYNKSRQLNLKDTDISILAREAYLSSLSLIETENIKIFFGCEDNLPTLKLDQQKIFGCIINLIKNAYESIKESGYIKLNINRENDNILLHISDTGCGIPPDLLPKIFEPYFTSKSYGTGLGLCITKRIIQAHNGDIYVDSKVAEGTTFTIRLPIEQHKNQTHHN